MESTANPLPPLEPEQPPPEPEQPPPEQPEQQQHPPPPAAAAAVARVLATRPLHALAAAGALMLAFSAAGPLIEPLQFDASVKGFSPRGTPMAERINTGILLQRGYGDETLRGFPFADCAAPPVELWLALCGSQAGGAVDTSSLLGAASAVRELLERLSGECSPICVLSVAPWYRECRERQGLTQVELAGVVADAITERLPATARTALSMLFATGQAGCASTLDCVQGMIATCDAGMSELLAENAQNLGAAPDQGGAGASRNDREFCHRVHEEGVDTLGLGVYYEAVDPDGDLLSAASLHEVCEFEARVLAYAGEQGYCQRRGMNSGGEGSEGGEGGACCPAHGYATALAWLLNKDCAALTDADIQPAMALVRTCDAARSESCVPGWLGAPCATAGDCVAADSTCRTTVAACKERRCVNRCETAGEGGMLVPLMGKESDDSLDDRIGGNVLDAFIFNWLDAGFRDTGRATLAHGSFTFLSSIHRDGADISQTRSKQQLLSLYNEILEDASSPSSEKSVKVLSYEGVMMMDIINQILISDVLLVVVALLMVFVAMVAHTGSFFISGMGCLHVLAAFPSAYTCYTLILGIKWMSMLNYIGIFVAVGIGADDIFVYTDAWSQSKVMLPADASLDARIAWTLHRAGSAMLVTSFTTSAAFATNYINNVVPMQLFGVFMALMVLFDYLYTVTWFPCVVAIHHKYIEPKYGSEHACHRCISRCRKTTGDASERLTAGGTSEGIGGEDDKAGLEESGGPAAAPSDLRKIEAWFRDSVAPTVFRFRQHIVGVTALVTLPLIVLTFSMQLDEGGVQAFPKWHNQRQYMDLDHTDGLFRPRPWDHWRGTTVNVVFGVVPTDSGDRFDPDDSGELVFDDAFDMNDASAQEWLLETIRGIRLEPFAMGAFLFPYFSLPEGDSCGGSSSLELAFDNDDGSIWTLADCERGADGSIVVLLNLLHTDDEAKIAGCEEHPANCLLLSPKLVDRVEIAWASGQAATSYRVEAAVQPGHWDELANVERLSPDRPPKDTIEADWHSYSFVRLSFRGSNIGIAEISTWGERPSVVEMVHMISESLPSGSNCGGGLPLPNFVECTGQLARLTVDPLTGNVTGLPGVLVFTGEDSRLRGLATDFHTTVGQGVVASWQYHKVRPTWDLWEQFTSAQLATAPPSCAGAWVASMAFLAAETQSSLMSACWKAGLLSLAIAFAVLMAATRNLTVSLLATTAIATILCWTVGIVVAMGWELGVMESMDIAILIGISCDFVVHFSHAYCECPDDGRQERMTHSLQTMGISVVAAAITTFTAAAILSLATLTFFDKFGSFLCVTMLASVFLSIIFFQALLGLAGPVKPHRLALKQ